MVAAARESDFRRTLPAIVEARMFQGRSATTVSRWVEVHRLAVAGREPLIARHVGHEVAQMWLSRSRFTDVESLAEATLTLGPDANAFYDLGWAQSATGRPRHALESYEQALRLYRETSDRAGEAATLNNIGTVHNSLGDRHQALTHYRQALIIVREIGDRAAEATTLNNIGHAYHKLGNPRQALIHYDQVLPIRREVGDRGSEAVAESNMAVLLLRMSRVEDAIESQRRAVALAEETSHPALDKVRAFLTQLEQLRKG